MSFFFFFFWIKQNKNLLAIISSFVITYQALLLRIDTQRGSRSNLSIGEIILAASEYVWYGTTYNCLIGNPFYEDAVS